MKNILLFVLVSSLLFSQTIPNFKLTDLNKKTVLLHQLTKENELTLVSMVTLSCPYCLKEIKDYTRLSQKFGTKKVGFVALFLDNNARMIQSLIASDKIAYPVLIAGADMPKYFGVRGVPFTFILDSNHNIIETIPGYVPIESMDDYITHYLISGALEGN